MHLLSTPNNPRTATDQLHGLTHALRAVLPGITALAASASPTTTATLLTGQRVTYITT